MLNVTPFSISPILIDITRTKMGFVYDIRNSIEHKTISLHRRVLVNICLVIRCHLFLQIEIFLSIIACKPLIWTHMIFILTQENSEPMLMVYALKY